MNPTTMKQVTKAEVVESLCFAVNVLHTSMEDAQTLNLDMDSFYLNVIALFWGLFNSLEFGEHNPNEIMEVFLLVSLTLLEKAESSGDAIVK